MPRRNTRLEAEGAEFLVLGSLLIHGVHSYKTYTNMPGYDVVAYEPEHATRTARISVKSRWDTGATGFLIKNFNCDFVVVAKLNRGSAKDAGKIKSPEFFILPIDVVRKAQGASGWGRIEFGKIEKFKTYLERWDLVRIFLSKSRRRPKETRVAV